MAAGGACGEMVLKEENIFVDLKTICEQFFFSLMGFTQKEMACTICKLY